MKTVVFLAFLNGTYYYSTEIVKKRIFKGLGWSHTQRFRPPKGGSEKDRFLKGLRERLWRPGTPAKPLNQQEKSFFFV